MRVDDKTVKSLHSLVHAQRATIIIVGVVNIFVILVHFTAMRARVPLIQNKRSETAAEILQSKEITFYLVVVQKPAQAFHLSEKLKFIIKAVLVLRVTKLFLYRKT